MFNIVIPNLYFIRAPEATPEETPTHTQTTEETPEQTPPMYDPTEIPIENVYQICSHCSFEGSLENPVLVTINKADFSNIENDDSNGAIRLQNAGLICSNLSFTRCQYKFGGGGAISINNNITGARNIIS
ncbi:hypothetical protein M9Y10_032198 [Tritrichomonas musculus]|uniref:Uncharacterized protein n=1 Tax=Tritrichomonas musculus TaxID=1915356 RepID=A0ABR2H001_9EUKA